MKAVHFNFHFSGFQLRALPGADGEFTLYEDENDGYNYEKGAYATIPFVWNKAKQTLTIGKCSGKLKERTFRVVFVSSNHGAGMAAEEKADAVVRYTGKPISVSVSLADIGFSGPAKVRDLWNHEDLGTVVGTLTQKINPHSAGLYRVHPQN
jgi:hypothetical protein